MSDCKAHQPVSFVTGANGFVGKAICLALLQAGHRLKLLTRSGFDSSGMADFQPYQSQLTIVKGDLRHPRQWQDALKDCDNVFNAAGEIRDETNMQALNVDATRDLLNACSGTNVKHITHLSSVGVIGSSRCADVDESEPPTPADTYERTKLEAEKVIVQWQRDSNIPVAMLRPTIIYGQGSKSNLIPFWFSMIRRGVVVTLGKEAIANFVHIDDVAQSCVVACNQRLDGPYIIANPVRLREFIHTASSVMQKKPIVLSVPPVVAAVIARMMESFFKILNRTSPVTNRLCDALATRTNYISTRFTQQTGWEPVDHRIGIRRTLI